MNSKAHGKVLYLDPWGGVAGDMLLAALLDLDEGEALEQALFDAVRRLGLEGVEVRAEEVVVRGFRARQVTVVVSGDQPRRSPEELDAVLARSDLSEWVKGRARGALRRLAEVEASLHGMPLERVHFHEIGGVDSLVDVAGCFALIDRLGRPEVTHGPVPLGSGALSVAHGTLRAPAPAALELLKGRPCLGGPDPAETATPTGALLLSELAESWGSMPAMLPEKVGYGAGHKELSVPNLLRAVLGTSLSAGATDLDGSESRDEVLLLQCAVDDASGEELGSLVRSLRAAGALDVWMGALLMKKGRPGVEISVLTHPGEEAPLLEVIFSQGTTFGVRALPLTRYLLERRWVTVYLGGERVRVKVGAWRGRVVSVAPEFDEAEAAAGRLGRSVTEIYQEASLAARAVLEGASPRLQDEEQTPST